MSRYDLKSLGSDFVWFEDTRLITYLAEKWFGSGPSRFYWPPGWRWVAGAFETATSGCCCCCWVSGNRRQVNWLCCDAGAGSRRTTTLSCCCCWLASDATESGGSLPLRGDFRRRRRCVKQGGILKNQIISWKDLIGLFRSFLTCRRWRRRADYTSLCNSPPDG